MSIILFDFSIQTLKPQFKSVMVVNEFLELFQKDLHGVSPERECDFTIVLLPDT